METKEKNRQKEQTKKGVKMNKKIVKDKFSGGGPASAVYGLGFIGALVYYISHATSFWVGMFGVIKAILWPAFLVYELLKFLGM